MNSSLNQSADKNLGGSNWGGRARSGTMWLVVGFGLGQIIRLGSNIVLAAILYEEAFALMAIVTALMIGLAMFSDIGLRTNVIHHPNGDDPNFLNTAWTLQVMRGACLFLISLLLAWPLSRLYGANDPAAYELVYLIPIVGLTSLVGGFQSAKLMTAARHLKLKEITKIEFVSGPFGVLVTLLLAWQFKSVYALAIAAALASILHTVLTYLMLDGPKSKFHLDRTSTRAIVSFGKWIFVSTVFTFLAAQLDRLALAAMFDLAEVGVYAIAASLAIIVPALAGSLQSSVLFPWYSRKLEEGVPIAIAFTRTRMAMMTLSSFLCSLLFAGAGSFFTLAYDSRYALGGSLLPVLSCAAWFSCLETMYNSTFLASGRSKWAAVASAGKVISFAVFLGILSFLESGIIIAATFLLGSEIIRWVICLFLGRRIGLYNFHSELLMLCFFLIVSMVSWWLVERAPIVSGLSPFQKLLLLGIFITALFAPLFLRYVVPLVRQRSS